MRDSWNVGLEANLDPPILPYTQASKSRRIPSTSVKERPSASS